MLRIDPSWTQVVGALTVESHGDMFGSEEWSLVSRSCADTKNHYVEVNKCKQIIRVELQSHCERWPETLGKASCRDVEAVYPRVLFVHYCILGCLIAVRAALRNFKLANIRASVSSHLPGVLSATNFLQESVSLKQNGSRTIELFLFCYLRGSRRLLSLTRPIQSVAKYPWTFLGQANSLMESLPHV